MLKPLHSCNISAKIPRCHSSQKQDYRRELPKRQAKQKCRSYIDKERLSGNRTRFRLYWLAGSRKRNRKVTELSHVVQDRAEGPKAPSPGQRPG